ncbi:hypothetical protein [Rhizobium rhizophilum]|uniref:hypothetical protein n=1 Tax=Rhizobium rhizophilum TaxID=1850373 RepID=UPI00197DC6D7|nr:hypothetical protein [Rhizobium rhizophilum]
MTFDGKAFGAEIVGVVKGYLEKEMAPLRSRIDALEKHFEAIPAPVDLSGDLEALKAALEGIVIPEIPQLPELPDFPAMIGEAVKAAVSVIPVPQNGKSVPVEDLAPIIASEVERRVSELPVAKDGKDGIDGKDGVGLAGALIDRNGELVVTLTDGATKSLGTVVGRDGEGKPGLDGFGFDDLDVVYDGEKTFTLRFVQGERVKEFPFVMPVVIDRGVYREGNDYKAGDAVTWAGSVWIAQKETSAKPDAGDDWRLSVKRGRDGKDGVVKEAKAAQPFRVGIPAGGS